MSDDFGTLVKFIKEHLGESDDTIKNIENSLNELNERWEALSKYRVKEGIDDPHKIHLVEPGDLKDVKSEEWDEQEYEDLSKLFHEIKHFIDKFQGLRIFKDQYQLDAETVSLDDEKLDKKSHVAYMLRETRRKVLHFFNIITEDLANNKFYQKLQEWIAEGSHKFYDSYELLEERLDLAKEDLISMLEHLEYKLLGHKIPHTEYEKDDNPYSDTIKDVLYSVKQYYKDKKNRLYETLEGSIHDLGESIKHGKDYIAHKVGFGKNGKKGEHDHDMVWRDESKMQMSDHPPPNLKKIVESKLFETNLEELHLGFKEIFKKAKDYVSAKVEKAKNLSRPEVIVDTVDDGLNKVKEGAENIKEKVKKGVDYASEKKDEAVGKIKDKVRIDKATEVVGEKIEDVKRIPEKIRSKAREGVETLKEKASEGVDYVTDKKDEIVEKVKKGVDYASELKVEAVEKIKDKVRIDKAAEYVGEKIEDVKRIPEKIKSRAREGVETLKEKASEGVDYVADKKDEVVEKVKKGVEYASEIKDKVKDTLGINKAEEYVSEKIDDVKRIPENIKNKVQEGVDYVSEVKEDLKESVRQAVEPPHFVGGMKQKIGAIKDSLRESKNFVFDTIAGGFDYLEGKKDELVNKVIDMTIAKREEILERPRNAAEKVVEKGKEAFESIEDSDKKFHDMLDRKNWIHPEGEPHNSPYMDYEDSDLEEEDLDYGLRSENLIDRAKDKLKEGKERIVESAEELGYRAKTGMQKLKEKLMKKQDGSEQLTEQQILDELSSYFNPNEPYMREFIDTFYKENPKKGELPHTEESLWRRVKSFFKRKFGFSEKYSKDDTKYVETKKTIHPHHLDEKKLRPDHIYKDDDKDYLKDQRNQLLDELTGRDDLFYYLADRGIDMYDVKEELLNYLLEPTDEGMSTWSDDPSLRSQK
jgi:methyl-accepting chemotaxis protein